MITRDKRGALQIRLDIRAAHLDYLDSTGVVEMAGPLLDADGQMCGSLVILDVANMTAAQDWATNDPSTKAGLLDTAQLTEWKKVIG